MAATNTSRRPPDVTIPHRGPAYGVVSVETLASWLRSGKVRGVQAAEAIANTGGSGAGGDGDKEDALESTAVVVADVRGDDQRGGHIPGSVWVPFSTFEEQIDALITDWQKLEGPVDVVFVCMYSNERGPSCASTCSTRAAAVTASSSAPVRVHLLQGGFHNWVNTFLGTGEEGAMIEAFEPALWLQREGQWIYAQDVRFVFDPAVAAAADGDDGDDDAAAVAGASGSPTKAGDK